ncbi:peroxiredoxin family protein [Paenibacillus provencensis]|uniref:Peroxiredoxin family protein n=1 Tax=Paenibacillus provencensis TaxID=441151 RepID=A0ABW3Q1V7_9BACL
MKKSLIGIIALLLLAGYGVYDYTKPNDTLQTDNGIKGQVSVGIDQGEAAPNFELVDTYGEPVNLSDFRGKKVLINFWATWCPPCRAEMPHMQNIYEDYKDEVVILGVNLTTTEASMEDVGTFIENYGLTFPIILDEQGEVMQTFRVVAYPTTYAVDRDGVIREIFRGAIDYGIMEQTLERMD